MGSIGKTALSQVVLCASLIVDLVEIWALKCLRGLFSGWVGVLGAVLGLFSRKSLICEIFGFGE